MKTTFWKAHAYGNDFVYVRAVDVNRASADTLAREMCDRHTGIGGDGLIVFERTRDGAAMRLYNADGGVAEVSGNGVRALAALLLHDDERVDQELVIETDGGPKRVTSTDRSGTRQTFRAAMGLPEDLRRLTVELDGESVHGVALNIGNPQFVVLGPPPDEETFERLGSTLERHPAFPGRTNVEFAYVESPRCLRIRIWERGVGPTLSSGTGSCAALVAAAAFGGADRMADVIAPGGTQLVEWCDDSVYLTGWAEVLCEGMWLRPLPT